MPQQLVITLDDNGNLKVNGPINNRMIAYGMLEMTRDLIVAYHNREEQKVQPATPDQVAVLSKPLVTP